MKPIRIRWSWALLGLCVFYSVGLVGHLHPLLLPWMLVLTPWFLLIAGAVALTFFLQGIPSTRFLVLAFSLFLMTFALEALGVATGLVFGAYHYGSVLGFLVLGVPPVIGWNWVLVVLGVHSGLQLLFPKLPSLFLNLSVGLLCVLFDLLLEPVAVHLGYWVWEQGIIPLQNYIAWGSIAFVCSWITSRTMVLPRQPILGWYSVVQSVFFLGLGLFGAWK